MEVCGIQNHNLRLLKKGDKQKPTTKILQIALFELEIPTWPGFPISLALRTNCPFSLAYLQLTQLKLFTWQYFVLVWF